MLARIEPESNQPPRAPGQQAGPLRSRSRFRQGLGWLEHIEDAIYLVIAVFLIGCGILLLFGAGLDVARNFDPNNVHTLVVRVLDETLLVFVVVELLHTVRVTLRDHVLSAEPFLIVGLIAGVRRILILTAGSESLNGTPGSQTLHSGPDFVVYWVQLILLIALVVAMVVALFIWRRTYPKRSD